MTPTSTPPRAPLFEQKQAVEKRFDGKATSYLRDRHREYAFVVQKEIVLEMLEDAKGRILDAGCGAGALQSDLLVRGFEVWGVDLSHEMIRRAEGRLADEASRSRVHFSVGDIENLDFPDAFFDGIVCMGAFEYLLSYSKVIEEIHRTLKPGGVAVITVPTSVSPYSLAASTVGLLYEWVRVLLGGKRVAEPFKTNRCIPRRLDRELEGYGLEKADSAYCNFVFYPLDRLCPRVSLSLNRSLRRLSRSKLLGWMGTQYLVKYRKRSP